MTVQGPITVAVADDQVSILDFAAREAMRARCGLRLVRAYAVPPAPPVPIAGIDIPASYRAGGQDVLDAAVRHLEKGHPHLQVECVLTRGHTPTVLEQESHEARLMVIGPAARKPWYVKMFEGEVTHHLVERAACPVIVVPSGWQEPHGDAPVVVVVDDGPTTQVALQFGHELAQARGAELRIVHCDEDPRGAVLSAAEGAGLLVLVDSLAREIVGAANCPVAVVPPGRPG